MNRLTAFLVALLAGLMLFTGMASAHAQLESSSPKRGEVLSEAPAGVKFVFNEPVDSGLGGVAVFDTSGEQVQSGDLETGPADEVGASLPPDLPDGLYTATYQVVSADSHPINGGITFTVGDPSTGGSEFIADQTISDLLSNTNAGKVTQVGFWADRWVGFMAIALIVGLLVWLLWVWGKRPAGVQGAVESRARKFLLLAIFAGLVATLLAIPFQGALITGQSFWSAFGSGIPGEVVDTRFGTVMLLRALALLLILPFAFRPSRESGGFRVVATLAVAGAALLVLTPGLAGHASTQDPGWLILPSNVLHVIAMAIWGGGLLAMFAVLPAATATVENQAGRSSLLLDVTRRFSTVALASVILVALTGITQSIVEVGSFPNLVETAFGRSVLIKTILFAVLVGLGWHNRSRIIPAIAERVQRKQSPGQPGVGLRRNLRIEVLLIIATLGVTAALVSYPPSETESSGPASGAVTVGSDRLDYTVDPATIGPNEIHIYLFDGETGAPVDVVSMTGTLTQPEAGVTPLDMELRKAGPGHYTTTSATLGVKGEWEADVAIRYSRFEEPSAEFKFEVE